MEQLERGKSTLRSVVIIGAGGFARETLDVIDAANSDELRYDVLGYIVDPEYGSPGTLVNELPILGGFDWLEAHASEVFAICGVGASHHRHHLIRRAEALGCEFFSVVHPRAILTRWLELGRGVVVTAGCILTNKIQVGDHVHLNLDCTIGHDATIGDYVTLAPGVHVSGNVTVGDGSYVGTGTNIIEGLQIGEWSTIGAGSTVIEDVPPNTTVVGVPGRVIKEREVGWHLR